METSDFGQKFKNDRNWAKVEKIYAGNFRRLVPMTGEGSVLSISVARYPGPQVHNGVTQSCPSTLPNPRP